MLSALALFVCTDMMPVHAFSQILVDRDKVEPESVLLPLNINEASDLSLDDLLTEAKGTLEQFNGLRLNIDPFLGLDADIDDRAVHHFGLLAFWLEKLIVSLDEDRANTGTSHLSGLPENTRSDASRLYSAIRRLQLLMEAQDQCGLRNLGTFLSAVETLAIELEDTLPGTKDHVQDLHYFFFTGHLPNVVPKEGGRLYVIGPGIRKEGRSLVTLSDPASGKIIVKLGVRQSRDGGVAAIRLDPEWITSNTGRCLTLEVSNSIASGMHWETQAEPPVQATLPFCIPQSYGTQFRVAGFLEYRTPTQIIPLKAKSIIFDNDSCVDQKQVSAGMEWTLPPGGALVAMGETPLYEAGPSSVTCSPEENRIHCTGYLGKAICGHELPVTGSDEGNGLLLELTEWEHIFKPMARVPLERLYRSHALSEAVDPESNTNEIEVLVPREVANEKTTMWYELIVVNGGQQKMSFRSAKKDLDKMQQSSFLVGHDRVTAILDPAPDANDSEIRVRIDPVACPY